MNNVIKLLLGLCLLMTFILLIEWWLVGSDDNEDISAVEQQALNYDIQLAELKLDKQSLESYSDIVERPLFIEGRRPVVEVDDDTNSDEVSKVDDLTLLGIYSIEEKRMALFSKKGKEIEYIKQPEGEDVAGWMLKKIQSDRVVLERGGAEQSLILRKPKPKVVNKSMLKRPVRKPNLKIQKQK